MQAQLLNLGLVLGLVQVSNYLNLESPEYLAYLRAAYLISQLVNLLTLFYVRIKILAKNDNTELKYQEPKVPFSQQEPEFVTTTFKNYDLAQLKTQFTQACIGLGFMLFLHLKFGYIRPVFFQTVLGLKNLVGTPLMQVYVLGKDMKRPWAVPSPFGGAASTTEAPTPKEVKNMVKKEIKEQKKKQ